MILNPNKYSLIILLYTAFLFFEAYFRAQFNFHYSIYLQIFLLIILIINTSLKALNHRIDWVLLITIVYITIFTLLSLSGGLKPGIFASLLSSIIFAKMFLFICVIRNLSAAYFDQSVKLLAVLQIAGLLITFFFPHYFNSLRPDVLFARDETRFIGFLLNPSKSAAISSILILYFSLIKKRKLLSLLFLMMLVLSQSRSVTLLTILIFAYCILARTHLSVLNRIALGFICLCGTLTVIFLMDLEGTYNVASRTINEDGLYIRAAMLMGGIKLALEFFPFGAGGGTFGTSLSSESQAYYIVGIADWRSVREMTGIFDSGVGSILGEYGILGIGLYGVFLFLLFYKLESGTGRIGVSLVFVVFVLFMNFFRTVASDLFYPLYFFIVYIIINRDRYLEGYLK